MKNTKISRRSFLLGLAACSAAGVLTACSGSSEPASSASTAPEPPASSAVSEVTAAPFLTVEDFPALDGSTACIPLMAQMLADTTGMDLEEAQSIISVSTTAYAWESFGLYNTDTKMLVVYEAPDSVKEELEAANVQLEQKPIGVDALVFIVNEDNPVTDRPSSSCGTSTPERSPTGRTWAARIWTSWPSSAGLTPAARPCSRSCSFRAAN